jgi:hypothetical protein
VQLKTEDAKWIATAENLLKRNPRPENHRTGDGRRKIGDRTDSGLLSRLSDFGEKGTSSEIALFKSIRD